MLKKKLLPLLCCFLAMNALSTVLAAPPQEGLQYTQLVTPVRDAPDVVEFFSFYCPPCAAFAGRYGVTRAVEKALPADTRVVKYHVSTMGALGEALTEAWSVARALGVESRVETPLFMAVQEKRSIKSKADIRQVFIDAGVPAKQYDVAMESLVVRAMTATQMQAAEKYGVTGTPSFFVKGKYLIRNNGINPMTEEGYGPAFAEVVRALLKK
ncbi:thioredoxin domain-containing protein [Salmonella enterica subsp. enterica serovar Oranienburg]|nr:disulfide bond formation protein DsbA [Salmonella enterica subsp. enterica serovar Telelkebir]EHB2254378.1 thioredoxin domain-containing protein [Salmonella enterica subsp. enterica serovar Oranienburg]EHE7835201.1 thioredoxin domain-containing protein [Salmonella enterica subsp. enterica serovar Oranienburg]EHV6763258.1 DsbA family protein [Salmonella enterica subsp. enterica serovar Johannesburg]